MVKVVLYSLIFIVSCGVLAGGAIMEKLDLNLKRQLAREPEGSFPVIITCKTSCDALLAHLEAANIAVGDGLVELQMLTGTLSGKQIETLATRGDVEQISLDEEATTQ